MSNVENLEEKIIALVSRWQYAFNETDMTLQEHREFSNECKELGVNTLDVIARMY